MCLCWNNATEGPYYSRFRSPLARRKRANPRGGGHHEIVFKFEYLGKIKFTFYAALEFESWGWGTCFGEEKKQGKIYNVSVPLKLVFSYNLFWPFFPN
jgi:hypothetical protein